MQLAETTPTGVRFAPTRARVQAIAAPVFAGSLVAFLFVLLMTSGFHRPAPHLLPLALSAPPAIAAKIGSALDAHSPGAFALRSYPSAAAVERAVADGDAVGGLSIGGNGATIVTAGAQGVATGQVVEGALGALAGAAGMPSRSVDLRPLPASDSFGLSGFMVVIGLTIASAIFAAVAFATGRRLDVRALLGGTAAFALLAGVAAALAVDTTVGAVGHFWAVAGIGALLALAVAGTVLALGRLLGTAGLGLGGLLVVLTSISTSGSVVGYRFEPAFHRALSQWLPAGSAVEALRDTLYFGSAHAGGRLAVLATWAAASLVVLALAGTVRAHRRPDASAGAPATA
jgi:hypothetical protein